jgi:aryl carrier-like protein
MGALKTQGPEVTLEKYMETKTLPDWSAIKSETQEPDSAPSA